jgi:hypothetical protein
MLASPSSSSEVASLSSVVKQAAGKYSTGLSQSTRRNRQISESAAA